MNIFRSKYSTLIHTGIVLLFSINTYCQEKGFPFVASNIIRTDNYTVLVAQDGHASEGIKPVQKEDHLKFHVSGWKNSDQQILWDVTVPSTGNYEVSVLLEHKSPEPFKVEVLCGNFITSRISDISEKQKWKFA
jgi:hypothetical protein